MSFNEMVTTLTLGDIDLDEVYLYLGRWRRRTRKSKFFIRTQGKRTFKEMSKSAPSDQCLSILRFLNI